MTTPVIPPVHVSVFIRRGEGVYLDYDDAVYPAPTFTTFMWDILQFFVIILK